VDSLWPTLAALGWLGSAWAGWWWWRQRVRRRALEDAVAAAREESRALRFRQQAAEREAEAQREALLNSMGEGVMLLDHHGRIRLVNPACRQLFGLPDDVRGRTVLEALRLHQVQELVERVQKGGQVSGHELDLPGLDRPCLQVSAAAVGSGEGQPPGMLLVFHDLTRLKQLENTRKEFVANVSHELRSPLALIKGCVETLQDGAQADPAAGPRFLRMIEKHADRLAYLIEDLLTLSQLDAGQLRLRLEPVGLGSLVARVMDDLAAPAAGRNVRLRNEVPAALLARVDGERLEQVLANLLDNAIKYGRAGGEVSVGARPAGGETLEVWVRDDGPGIPSAAQARLFERFYRLDKARSREQGGTGLGLAIVKHIVQAHGGEVRVESEPGRGTAFFFTVPAGPC